MLYLMENIIDFFDRSRIQFTDVKTFFQPYEIFVFICICSIEYLFLCHIRCFFLIFSSCTCSLTEDDVPELTDDSNILERLQIAAVGRIKSL